MLRCRSLDVRWKVIDFERVSILEERWDLDVYSEALQVSTNEDRTIFPYHYTRL
jgi:hypothetical protein